MLKAHWCDEYKSLNLYSGKIEFISEDDEDMIEIRYSDGMLIDVGKPTASNIYYITVLSSDDIVGWQNPLAELSVANKVHLVDKIQETITEFRFNSCPQR